MTDFIRVDFHCHTHASRDSLAAPQEIIAACRNKGIDRLVITDHNTIAGALEARQLAPDLIIVGEEIMTTQGEILAAFVTEQVPRGLSPQETIHRLREQGAFISVSHPFDFFRSGYWGRALEAIASLVDAVEVFNARSPWQDFNRRAKQFALQHGLGGTAGSDAHSAWEVGRGLLLLPPFEAADGLRAVIGRGRLQADPSPFWVRFFSRYASLRRRVDKLP